MIPVSVSPSRPVDGGHVVYAADQPEYQPLPVWNRQDGRVVSRWTLTWRERFAALLGRPLYVEVMTFGSPLQPVFLTWSEAEALYADAVEGVAS
jgi:hypothetical protein